MASISLSAYNDNNNKHWAYVTAAINFVCLALIDMEHEATLIGADGGQNLQQNILL